ncbi:hypothetical protein C8J56DRAFT_980899 [Mycena floridula]|nr:hypothetical protein C8J56DRAFT_980899 [Mycena floridula]
MMSCKKTGLLMILGMHHQPLRSLQCQIQSPMHQHQEISPHLPCGIVQSAAPCQASRRLLMPFIVAAVDALHHINKNMSTITSLMSLHGINNEDFTVRAGFNEDLIIRDIGHLQL